MTDEPNIDPELAVRLQAQVDFINLLEDRYGRGEDIGPILDQVDDVRRARGLVVALIMARAGDRERVRQLLDEWEKRKHQYEQTEKQFTDHVAAEMKRALEAPDLDAARLRISELERVVAELEKRLTDQQELIDELKGFGLN